MAEAAGLTLSAVALASLFSTCIECFGYYQSAVKAKEEIKSALVALDLEKTRLLIWGDQVGICRTPAQGRTKHLDRYADSVKNTLEQLEQLLKNAEGLRDRYGRQRIRSRRSQDSLQIQDDLSQGFKSLFVSQWDTFRKRYLPNSSRFMDSPKWAIQGREEFQALLAAVRGLIQGLNQFIRVPDEIVTDLIQQRLREIGLVEGMERLRVVEAEEARRAETIIEESRRGTLDQRNEAEVMQDTHEGIAPSDQQMVQGVTDMPQAARLPGRTVLVFVATDECLRKSCDYKDFNQDVFVRPPKLSFESNGGSDDIHHTVIKEITHDVDAETVQTWAQESSSNGNFAGKLATVLIYCPPCIHQIHTAMHICAAGDYGSLYSFKIRVDDRLTTSCRSLEGSTVAFKSLLSHFIDILSGPRWYLRDDYLDRQWMVQRQYDLEENEDRPNGPSKQAGDFLNPGRTVPNLGAVVVLGEVSHLIPIMNSGSFTRVSTMPRATQIWNMSGDASGKRTLLGTYIRSRAIGRSDTPTALSSVDELAETSESDNERPGKKQRLS